MLTLTADETQVCGHAREIITTEDRRRSPARPWQPAAERLASEAVGAAGTFLLAPSIAADRSPLPGMCRYHAILVAPLTPRGWPLLGVVAIDVSAACQVVDQEP